MYIIDMHILFKEDLILDSRLSPHADSVVFLYEIRIPSSLESVWHFC